MATQVIIDIDIKGAKDVLETRKQIRAINQELKVTKDSKAYDKLLNDLIVLKSRLKTATKEQRNAVNAFTATDEGAGAYARLSAQLLVAKVRLKDLRAEGKSTGKEVDDLTREVNQLDTSLKNIDQSVGETGRQVGAYEEAVRRAVGITDKQTGAFTRMTGKLNILKKEYKDIVITQGATSKGAIKLRKEIDRLERSLKKAGDTGKQAGKRIGGINRQIRNLGPAFAGLATGFLVFSELPQVLGDINEGLRDFGAFLSPAEALNKRFGESIKDAATQLINQKGELALVFDELGKTQVGTDEYTDAIERATEQFPFLNDEIIQSELALGNLESAQRLATQALIDDIAQQKTEEQVLKIRQEFIDKLANSLKITADATTTTGKVIDGVTESIGTSITSLLGPFAQLAQVATGTTTEFSKVAEGLNNQQLESLKEQAANINDFQNAIKNGLVEIDEQFAASNQNLTAQAEKNAAKLETQRTEAQEKALLRSEAQAEKAAERALLQAQRTAQRIADQRAKNQQRFLDQEVKDANARANLLLSLSVQLVTAELKNLEEGEKKQIALEQDATQKRIAALEAQNEQFKTKEKERIADAIKLFGEGSSEVLALETQLGNDRVNIKKQIDALIEQEEIASQTRIEKIRKDFADKEAAERKKRFESIKSAAQKVLDAKIKEREEIAKLQEKQTAKLIAEEEKRKEAIQKNTQFALEQASKLIGALDSLVDASSERRIKRVEDEQAERDTNLEGLNESLQTATGLERAFLQQQITQQTKAAEELAKKKERIEKDAAINNKAIALIQAGINVALGVTQALASLPPPISFITAGITAAIGAAEIIAIASQPLATGGIVGNAQNIATQPNGDNVLTTLTRGEVVLNKGQQARLGGAKTFSSIGVPGFANGGIVSPPLGAPSITRATQQDNNLMQLAIETRNLAISNREMVMRLEVVYTNNTENARKADEQDRIEIKAEATL